MKIRQNNEKNLASILFFLSICVCMFAAYKYNETTRFIDIPHIEITTLPIYLIIGLYAVSILLVIVQGKITVNSICLMLLLRLLLHFIPAVYCSIGHEFGINYVTSMLCLLTYTLSLNFSENEDLIKKILRIILIVISVQTVAEATLSSYSINSGLYAYKHDLTIPIGSSNAIASKIIPCFIFLSSYQKKRIFKVLYYIAMVALVAITRSRGGLICCLLIIAFEIVWKNKLNIKQYILGILVFAVLVVGLLYFSESTNMGRYVFSDDLGTLLSREGLWNKGIKLFLKHPGFGNGFSIEMDNYNPHNFIIHILARSGIAGIIVFAEIFTEFTKQIKGTTDDPYIKAAILYVVSVLIFSLVENVLFNYTSDIMIWFMLGTISYKSKLIKNSGMYTRL